MTAIRILASALCLAATCATAFADDPLPRAKPEEVGLSSERLTRIGETLKADIDKGRIPGAVIAIARRGKLVALDAYGWRDKAANVPMTTDTIFNITSMTKPMTAVGALMLVEQGKLLIDDPRRRLARSAGTTDRRSMRWCIKRSWTSASLPVPRQIPRSLNVRSEIFPGFHRNDAGHLMFSLYLTGGEATS
jgi:CubicO group peptidase (beta-lactamase class C family)